MAGPMCKVCSHIRRKEIDQALVSGVPTRRVARQFGLDHNTVGRHRSNHLPTLLARAQDQLELRHSQDLAMTLNRLYQKGHDLMLRAEAEGDTRAALVALRELVNVVEVAARAAGVAEAPPLPARGPILIRVVYDDPPPQRESLENPISDSLPKTGAVSD